MSNVGGDGMTLSALFEKLIEFREDLEKSTAPVSSDEVQTKVTKSIELCHNGIQMINELSVFSDNENIDEVTTEELKYLLLPAFSGYFNDKVTTEERIDVIRKSRECFINFLKLCKLYGLTNYKIDIESSLDGGDVGSKKLNKNPTAVDHIKDDSARRKEKINRYKLVKKMETDLEELHEEVKKEHVDDETKREYYLKLINRWIYIAIDTIESIDNEMPLLEHMKKLKSTSLNKSEPSREPCDGHDCHKHSKQKFQPFIITKDNFQKQVFGLGYPSIPTVSVDEFYDQRVQEGLFPNAAATAKKPEYINVVHICFFALFREKEATQKDKNEDDEEALSRARRWDEYRDDHRRGWGNMHNKG
ncbi:hypothetical protein HELRODRAFT_84128 [Helobdella robusta]|uniref:Immunoglobulin-binding protein 1 n=1 Tax=Helobdella robusta TaxID=6412 RepID=T1G5F0_HELRO|nr:hypothetical protein HELRODRAFT_84128 [Helobdella robusta]ESN99497.1 hypothetical protein HELRODRAFT_84128 [Helobdella robusta]